MLQRLPLYALFLSLLIHILLRPAVALELTEKEKEFINTRQTITVHNETDWPPFNFHENGAPQGISIDVMNRVAELTGLEVEYVTGPSWDQFVEMIKTDQLDVMLNIVDLAERKDTFQFSSVYVKSLTGVFVHNKDVGKYFSFKDLEGETVAIPAGFDLEITMPKYYPKIKLLPVRDILACIEAVHSGKAVAFMEEIGVVDYIVSQRMMPNIRMAFQVQDEPFISDLTIGTSIDKPLLHSIIQKGLNAISGDELNRIRKKWLLQVHEIYERRMVNLTVPEKEFLYKYNSVRMCVDPSWPPLDFIDNEGNHSGLSADLITTLARRLDISLELIPTSTWEESLATIRDGGCDIIPLMNETKESAEYLNFSRPYFDFATVIATRKDASFIGDYSELYGKKVALQAFFFITEYVKEHHPQIEIIEVENTREALKLVSEQKAFATIDGLPTVVNTIEALALENIKIVGSVPQQNSMKLGAVKGSPMLLSILDKGVASLTEQEKIGFYRKWLDIEVESQLFNQTTVFRIIFGLTLIVFFLLWRQFTLNRYANKLKALNEQLHHYSTVDHLTQVFNRRTIEKRLQTEIEKANLTGSPVTLVIFDIDHFKQINDTYGHLAGDDVLRNLADHVAGSIRQSDHFGRWGGEEFIIILPGTAVDGGLKLIENLRKSIERFDFGLGRSVTVSFGIGQYRMKEEMAPFISRIDNCLYNAKKLGRNRVVHSDNQ